MSRPEIDLKVEDGLPNGEKQEQNSRNFDVEPFGVDRIGGGAGGCNSSGSGGSSCGGCDDGS
jgi:hypothetical protein